MDTDAAKRAARAEGQPQTTAR
ncbi:hypothetical protein [Mycolicibacterium sp. 120266]